LPEKRPIANVKHVIAVSSAKGGVGKSTIAGKCCEVLVSALFSLEMEFLAASFHRIARLQ
jgi:predicted GTPase